jgi:hypothetical protein
MEFLVCYKNYTDINGSQIHSFSAPSIESEQNPFQDIVPSQISQAKTYWIAKVGARGAPQLGWEEYNR